MSLACSLPSSPSLSVGGVSVVAPMRGVMHSLPVAHRLHLRRLKSLMYNLHLMVVLVVLGLKVMHGLHLMVVQGLGLKAMHSLHLDQMQPQHRRPLLRLRMGCTSSSPQRGRPIAHRVNRCPAPRSSARPARNGTRVTTASACARPVTSVRSHWQKQYHSASLAICALVLGDLVSVLHSVHLVEFGRARCEVQIWNVLCCARGPLWHQGLGMTLANATIRCSQMHAPQF